MIKVCVGILNTSDGQKENIRNHENGIDYEVNAEKHLVIKDESGKAIGTYSAFCWVERA